ncbi:1757_t:CDS:10 [Diversispora eburnea]|uniref:type I protein arginine methyltransferase n=1 Tax=Diversispora eburnea TaxID=1213867 RepID=A0A9N9A686_9GLOM|nr:1757_t:CDS:10 [Diversispora eburnea]
MSLTSSECSESENDSNDERWDDWEEEEGNQQNLKCLFCKQLFSTSSNDLFFHCIEYHGFDFQKIRLDLKLDFYQSIRLINYIRKQVLEIPELENVTSYSISEISSVINNDEYLKPVLEEDSLLYAFDNDEIEDDDFDEKINLDGIEDQNQDINPTTPLEHELLKKLRITEEKLFNTQVQLKKVETQSDEYRNMVKESLFDIYSDAKSEKSMISTNIYGEMANYYFDSYAKTNIHEEMLKDRVRTESYRDFVYENKDLFKGKTVLDVGCAKAGASQVFSVDKSDIIHRAKEIVKENQLENVITLINSKVEDINLPVPKVDIIISEWMGYFLLFEGMLDSLIVARDQWLSQDGILAPSYCQLFLAAIEDDDLINDKFNFWNDVYGFKMTAMKNPVRQSVIVDYVKPQAIITNEVPLYTIDKFGLNFTSPFTFKVIRDGPNGTETHWGQTIFMLEHGISVECGTIITGSFDCRKSKENPRDLDLKIKYKVIRTGGEDDEKPFVSLPKRPVIPVKMVQEFPTELQLLILTDVLNLTRLNIFPSEKIEPSYNYETKQFNINFDSTDIYESFSLNEYGFARETIFVYFGWKISTNMIGFQICTIDFSKLIDNSRYEFGKEKRKDKHFRKLSVESIKIPVGDLCLIIDQLENKIGHHYKFKFIFNNPIIENFSSENEFFYWWDDEELRPVRQYSEDISPTRFNSFETEGGYVYDHEYDMYY